MWRKQQQSDRKTTKDSDKPITPFEKIVYIVVASISLICVLIGILLKLAYKDDHSLGAELTSFFFSEIGIAGIISLILIFTIESFSRRRHEKAAKNLLYRVNKDMFHAIYQRYIPQDVFAEVEKCLLGSSVYRRDYSIDYTLNHITDEEAKAHSISDSDKALHICCGIFSGYKLKNMTERHERYPVEMHLELPIDPSMRKFISMDCVTIDGEEISGDKLDQLTETTDTHAIYKHEVTIPPNGEVKVDMKCHTIKRKIDMEVWSSRLPSEGLTLRVAAPSDIEICATANHSEQLQRFIVDKHTTIWKLEYGIFPFQSVIFWWKAA